MAERSIVVRLKAQVGDYTRGMQNAAKATESTALSAETAGGRIAESMGKHEASWQRAGTALLGFGAATTAAVAGTVKAAMDWESAWTGVTKTVDATATTSMPQLEAQLRGLAKELPATHEEIAGVAEAAGQLGVGADDITEFTKTMINLGETTNLSADEAATSLARFSNVMGTNLSDVDRLGSVLVGLGNNFATTESEIAALGQRLAGTGHQLGMTEGDVYGMSAAMSSLGIEAEAGGTAMSMTLKGIDAAVRDGGDELQTYADLAGMTAEEFTQAWGQDAAGATADVVTGLGELGDAGGDVSGVLSELGINGARQQDVMLRLAAGSETLTAALTQGNDAWSENSALAAEAAKRYETTEAKLAIAKNTIVDSAIDIGEALLPAVAGIADGIAGIVDAFQNLPGPVKSIIGILGGVVGVASLAGGAFLTFAPKVASTVSAFKDLSKISPKASGAVKGFGKAMGAFAGAQLAAAGIDMLADALAGAQRSASETTDALLNMPFDEFADSFTSQVGSTQDLSDAFHSLTDGGITAATRGVDGFVSSILPITSSTDRARESFQGMDQALTAMFDSNPEQAARLFDEALESTGGSTEELLDLLPGYRDAQLDAKNATDQAGTSQGELATETDNAATALEEQAAAADEAYSALQTLAGNTLSLRDAQRGFQESIAAGTQALADNGATLDINTEAGRANQAALDDVAKSGLDVADSLRETGASSEEIQASVASSRAKFVSLATSMGMSKDDADKLADSLGLIPGDYTADVNAETGQADANTKQTQSLLDAVPGKYQADLDAATAAANGKIETSQDKADAFDRFLGTADLDANTRDALSKISGADAKAAAWDRMTATADVRASDSTASGVASAKRSINSVQGKQVTVTTYFKVAGDMRAQNAAQHAAYYNRAAGGPIVGPGTGTSDSIPAMLSNGEHVLTAAEVRMAGGQGGVYALRAAIRAGGLRFADGGAVRHHGPPAGYAAGGAVSVAAAASSPIYVQNPFTGEYLLAQMGGVAQAQQRAVSANTRAGRR